MVWSLLLLSDPVIGMVLRTLSTAALRVQDPRETFPLDLSSRESLFFSSKSDFPYRKYELLYHVSLVALASRKLIVQHIQAHYIIYAYTYTLCAI